MSINLYKEFLVEEEKFLKGLERNLKDQINRLNVEELSVLKLISGKDPSQYDNASLVDHELLPDDTPIFNRDGTANPPKNESKDRLQTGWCELEPTNDMNAVAINSASLLPSYSAQQDSVNPIERMLTNDASTSYIPEHIPVNKTGMSTDLLLGSSQSNDAMTSNRSQPATTTTTTKRKTDPPDHHTFDAIPSEDTKFILPSRTDVNCTVSQSNPDNVESRVPSINTTSVNTPSTLSPYTSPSEKNPDLNKGTRKSDGKDVSSSITSSVKSQPNEYSEFRKPIKTRRKRTRAKSKSNSKSDSKLKSKSITWVEDETLPVSKNPPIEEKNDIHLDDVAVNVIPLNLDVVSQEYNVKPSLEDLDESVGGDNVEEDEEDDDN